MLKVIGWLVAGLVGGLVLAQVISLTGENQKPSIGLFSTSPSTESGASSASLEQRILSLESQLSEEIKQRQRLENLLGDFLDGRWLGEEQDVEESAAVQLSETNQRAVPTPEERQQQIRERAVQRQQNFSDRRVQRLESAGFPPDQAAWILRREEEIRLEDLNAQWERRRQSFLNNEDGQQSGNPLREELGEEDYERYLEATGRPTTVYVSQLVGNSQASAAGFQAGDEIVRYNGQRVYNFNDLNLANVQGALGEPVVIDIVRNGAPMQLTVERGPLGIVGGRRRGGR